MQLVCANTNLIQLDGEPFCETRLVEEYWPVRIPVRSRQSRFLCLTHLDGAGRIPALPCTNRGFFSALLNRAKYSFPFAGIFLLFAKRFRGKRKTSYELIAGPKPFFPSFILM